MSSTLPGTQDLLDKTLAGLEALLGAGGLIRDPYKHHCSDSGLQSRTKKQKLFSFHYSVFFFDFINMVFKINKQEGEKKANVFQEGIFVKAIN